LIFVAAESAAALERELTARELPVARVGECAALGEARVELV
jgi:hypothetical protein